MESLIPSPSFATTASAMGVYVGIQQMEYGNLAAPHLGPMGAFTATGTPLSVAAGRLSFTYGLKGRTVLHDRSPPRTSEGTAAAEVGVDCVLLTIGPRDARS